MADNNQRPYKAYRPAVAYHLEKTYSEKVLGFMNKDYYYPNASGAPLTIHG